MPFGNVITKISLEQFEQEWVNAPDFIAEACFIVLIGDEFVGYSSLTQGEGYYWTAMTGVLPEYRGRGVATLLKLYAIRYAQEHGNLEIRAVNDLSNEAILALGTKLGFKRQGAMIRFVKRLNNETSEEVEH